MVLKFAANLNFLFNEGSPNIISKIYSASQAGFRAIEIPFSADCVNEIVKAKETTNIEVALINIKCSEKYAFGCASVPGADETFKENLHSTVDFAKKLSCKKIHIMSGKVESDEKECLQTYINNLKYAASYLKKEDILGVIEPINKYALSSYFMNNYETATAVLKEVNSKNLKLMMDIFHLQHIQGNICNTFQELRDFIGHIQIAQVPHRHEPDIPGELDFSFIFRLIEEIKYDSWIGCEYKPKTDTVTGLKWISKYGLKL